LAARADPLICDAQGADFYALVNEMAVEAEEENEAQEEEAEENQEAKEEETATAEQQPKKTKNKNDKTQLLGASALQYTAALYQRAQQSRTATATTSTAAKDGKKEDVNADVNTRSKRMWLKKLQHLPVQEAVDMFGNNMLMIAAATADLQLMQRLTMAESSKIEDVNAKNALGWTAMHWAAVNSRFGDVPVTQRMNIIETLETQGAKTESSINIEKQNVLHLATAGYEQVYQHFLNVAAKNATNGMQSSMVNQMDRLHSFTPLVYACADLQVNPVSLQLLLDELLSMALSTATIEVEVSSKAAAKTMTERQVLELQLQQAILVACSVNNMKALDLVLQMNTKSGESVEGKKAILHGDTLTNLFAFAKHVGKDNAELIAVIENAEAEMKL